MGRRVSLCRAHRLGVTVAASTYYEHRKKSPGKRQLRDEELAAEIQRVHRENFGVYSTRYCGHIPPAEMEAAHYAQNPAQ